MVDNILNTHICNIGFAATNNAVEGWQRGFNSSIGIYSSLWKFIDLIKFEQSKNEIVLNQIYGRVNVRDFIQIFWISNTLCSVHQRITKFET